MNTIVGRVNRAFLHALRAYSIARETEQLRYNAKSIFSQFGAVDDVAHIGSATDEEINTWAEAPVSLFSFTPSRSFTIPTSDMSLHRYYDAHDLMSYELKEEQVALMALASCLNEALDRGPRFASVRLNIDEQTLVTYEKLPIDTRPFALASCHPQVRPARTFAKCSSKQDNKGLARLYCLQIASHQ